MSTETPLEMVSTDRIDGSELMIEFLDGTSGVLTTQQGAG